jgi:hypothetical protein
MAFSDYFTRHPDLSARMREVLLDWIVDVNGAFNLRTGTFFVTVNVIDRFLELTRTPVTRSQLQLVGAVAMMIASKCEEVHAPTLAQFVDVTDNTYTTTQARNMECRILTTLDYRTGSLERTLCVIQSHVNSISRDDDGGNDDGVDGLEQIVTCVMERLALSYSLWQRYNTQQLLSAVVQLVTRCIAANSTAADALMMPSATMASTMCLVDVYTHLFITSPATSLKAITTKYTSKNVPKLFL